MKKQKEEKITFDEFKKQTSEDCDALAKMISDVKVAVNEGNMDAFEKFFMEGGTEEGDAKINDLLERLVIRFVVRKDMVA